ncbi:hypothetical protein [Pseudobacteriovorax antillogorgiicola]|uniref:Uncharacterized protein n=1 Tax=Pseudobacteriovorax antillogorgiicola TaxID=1513793 RepID=A0A1Y6CLA3_9BACT|nr:hypothetical protein [Pseudobacteriovorax antillogorgiicola]TCS47919.1 hypothetical protein EDD56_11930 [Pseudobacteriovorax antillogorgiicola]SMF57905.1 hypothetical protein SAMN06296036_11931 [Pseudobacteriovorax antillogorgiicola]
MSAVNPKFQDFLVETSSNSLKSFTNLQFETTILGVDDLPFYQYLATMVIGSSENKVLLTVHFWSDDASVLTKDPRKILDKSVKLDIFKEYLNIYSSKIKNQLNLQGLDLGISLPFIAPGYQSYFILDTNAYTQQFCWELKRNKTRIGFGCGLAFKETDVLNRIAESETGSEEFHDLEML